MDTFYIDESHDRTLYAVTAVAVPFLRRDDDIWRLAWPDCFQAAKDWRRRMAKHEKIPPSKELHAVKLASGRGNYIVGKRQIPKADCAGVYGRILKNAKFLPDGSVITVVGRRGQALYGHQRLERVMNVLFQRMRSQCIARGVNAMLYFDEGHPEYRSLYRKATKTLLTGSRYGNARNLPLDMFVEDGNEKDSRNCQFIQLADLLSYAALQKIRGEQGLLPDDHRARGLAELYDKFPAEKLNQRASNRNDSIVWVG